MQQNFNIKPIISLFLILAIGFTLIVVIGKVLIPFLVALILAYIFNPLVEKINKKFKIKRSIVSLIFTILILEKLRQTKNLDFVLILSKQVPIMVVLSYLKILIVWQML